MLCGEETIPPTLDSAGPSLCGQRGSTVSSSHTTLKRDVERDAAVSGTKSPLFEPVLEHHVPHSVLNTGVLLGVHLTEVERDGEKEVTAEDI